MPTVARASTISREASVLESELHILARFAEYHRNIVEVGSWTGRSARAIADNTPGQLHCVDPWDGFGQIINLRYEGNAYTPQFKQFQNNLKDHIESGKVKFFKGEYKDFWIENPDMIFIDAVHTYEAVKADILHSLKMMKYGLLCGHDYAYYWPGVIQCVDEIFPTRKVEDTIWYVELP